MVLAIDIGNTNIVIQYVGGGRYICERLSTDATKTVLEYASVLKST